MKQKSLKLWHAVSAWGILIILLLLFIDSMTDFTSTERIKNRMKENKEAFIGKPEIEIKDGVFTPEAMLAMGRLSDPQVSPDGTKILYGVSYTSIDRNRSCNNLYICNIDGSSVQRLTAEGKSFSNARWSADGESIAFIQGGQIWTAKLKGHEGAYRLGKKVRISDVPAGTSRMPSRPTT